MRARTSLGANTGPFYGWVVVAAVFIVMMVTSGLGFYNASVILKAAVDEFDIAVGTASGATGLFFGVSGVTGFLASKRMDQIDLRLYFVAGGVIGAIALYALRWIDSVIEIYLFFVVFGVGFSLCGLIPGTTLVARWFDKKRAMALSIASTGLSLGGIVVLPFAASSITDRGLAASGQWMSVLWFLGVVPATILFIRSYPSDKGLEPDGAPAPPTPVALPGMDFAQATKTRFFRGLCVTYGLIFLAQVGGIAHLFSLISERTDDDTAKFVLAALSFISVIGRLGGGVIVLKVGARRLTVLLTLIQGFALVLYAVADTTALLLVATVIFGLSIGNLLMLQPLLLADAFGVKAYSRIYSFNQLFGTIGLTTGPLILGVLRDAVDYRASFLAAALANVLGFVALLSAGSVDVPKSSWQPTPAAA